MSLSVRFMLSGIDIFLCATGPWGVGPSSCDTCLESGVLAVDCTVPTVMVDAAEGL